MCWSRLGALLICVQWENYQCKSSCDPNQFVCVCVSENWLLNNHDNKLEVVPLEVGWLAYMSRSKK